MLHKFFAMRCSRWLASKPSRRLELEALEDRLSPALVVGGAPVGPYVAGGSFDAVPGASVIVIPQNSPIFNGDTSDYPTYYRGFDYSSEAYILTVLTTGTGLSPNDLGQNAATGSIASGPPAAPSFDSMQVLGQMLQLVGTLSTLAAVQTQNPAQVFNLAVDEFFAAVDTSALAHAQGMGINTSALQSDLTAHLTAIQNNPVDHTPIGQLLGTAVHNTALYMLAINQGVGT